MMFLDCPACLDEEGAVRCGLPAEVRCRFSMRSTGGPLESARPGARSAPGASPCQRRSHAPAGVRSPAQLRDQRRTAAVLAGEGHHREGIVLRAASFAGGLRASEGVIVS
jgi:hypothetical protein